LIYSQVSSAFLFLSLFLVRLFCLGSQQDYVMRAELSKKKFPVTNYSVKSGSVDHQREVTVLHLRP